MKYAERIALFPEPILKLISPANSASYMHPSSSTPAVQDIPADILGQAINWVVKLRSGTVDAASYARMQAEIEAWRHADPLCEAAWQELQASEENFRKSPAIPSMLAFQTLETVQENRSVRQGRRKALRLLGLGATGIAVGVLASNHLSWHQLAGSLTADYATGTGEHRTIALADGTQIKLNTGTAIDVRFTDTHRLIVLYRGEIFIHTGKDVDTAAGRRPFWVQTAQTRLQAIGTQFLVHQEEEKTRLLVTEGRVAIHGSNDAVNAIAEIGDEYLIGADGVASKVADNVFDATGWIDGALVAKQMRLGDLVTELARYRQGWLRCDSAVADLLVSGVFQINDTDGALEALTRSLPIRVERRTRYWVTLMPS